MEGKKILIVAVIVLMLGALLPLSVSAITPTPTQAWTFVTVYFTPTKEVLVTPYVTPTPTANCVPAFDVWICDRKP
jgi:hypothetical protein